MDRQGFTLVHITTVPQSLSFVAGQVGYMKQRGVEVHALSSPGTELDLFGSREQVSVHAVDMPRRISPFRDLIALFRIWRSLRQVRPHIVHTHTPKGGLLGIVAAWLAGVPVRIFHVHGLPAMGAAGFKRFLLRCSDKVSCLLAHQVLCDSHSVRDVAVAQGLCPGEKIRVLLHGSVNGVDATGQFNPARIGEGGRERVLAAYGIPPEAVVVGFVGRIVREKGLVELAAAWDYLREEYPGLYLMVVGPFERHDPVPADVERLLRTDPRIRLTGMVRDTSPLYSVMDLMVLPSYREGLGTVLLEASAMALPVVATRVPGCINAVEDGVSGILVPPRDVRALTEAIRAYLNDPGLRHKHGKAGRLRVMRDFRQESIWRATYDQYLALLRTRR